MGPHLSRNGYWTGSLNMVCFVVRRQASRMLYWGRAIEIETYV